MQTIITNIFSSSNWQLILSETLEVVQVAQNSGVFGPDAVLAVDRPVQIEELSKVLSSLKESWLNLSSDDQQTGHRID
jgi:hypothetical protein